MGCCNCLVIGRNCVYLNLQWCSPFTVVLRKLFLWAIARKQTENRTNHPTKINYWGNNYFWLVFHIWLWFVVFFSVNTKDCNHPTELESGYQHWKAELWLTSEIQTNSKDESATKKKEEKKHEKKWGNIFIILPPFLLTSQVIVWDGLSVAPT